MRLVLSVLLLLSVATTHVAFGEEFTFHNQSSFVDEGKIMHVYGEIRNESGTPMKDVFVTARFYDKDGNLLNEYLRQTELRVLGSGESSPFEVLYLESGSADRVADFKLSATGQQAEAKPKELAIVTSNSRLDVFGTYFINVTAKNNGNLTATNSVVVATLYDKDGKVVTIGRALAESEFGSGNVGPDREAGFGVAVIERLQTYKAVRYTLVAESDQYVSDTVFLQAAGLGVSSKTSISDSENPKSGCLIATAAFGSEIAPQVQKLRTFRDGLALQTFAGSSFMNVFNSWYYSFSPAVADYERQSDVLRGSARVAIYPLLGILDLSTTTFDMLDFNKEAAIIGAGLTASSLIGVVYFAPLTVGLILLKRKKGLSLGRAKYVLLASWLASFALVAGATVLTNSELMMAGTALMVITTIATVVLALVRFIKL